MLSSSTSCYLGFTSRLRFLWNTLLFIWFGIFVFTAPASIVFAQNNKYQEKGYVNTNNGQIEVVSSSPRPISQAIIAINEEYGWFIDYEDVPHSSSSSDVKDITDPVWRSHHINERPFLGVTGGAFHALLPMRGSMPDGPMQSVKKIVSEYNNSSMPGQYSVRQESDGRISVVGVAARSSTGSFEEVPVLLDTIISLRDGRLSLTDALRSFASTLTKASGHQVVIGTVPTGVLNQTMCVIPGGQNISRKFLIDMLDSAPVKVAWHVLYDINNDLYVINLGQ